MEMSLLREKLERSLTRLVEGFPGVMGIGARGLDGEEEPILMNGDEVFPIGSSIKIPILLEFFRKVEAGTLDSSRILTFEERHTVGGSGVIQFLTPGKLTMPLMDYATLMINVSDNVATNIMIDLVGMDDVNRLLDDLGLKVTRLQRKMIDWEAARAGKENVSTPREAIRLLDCIYNKRGVSAYVSESALNVMKKPKVGAIRNSVPDEIEVADKSGGVPGVSCDLGVVLLPKGPYAVAVMTKHIPVSDFRNLETASYMRRATKLINDHYEEMSLATCYGRRI